jgi:hypothetical protein
MHLREWTEILFGSNDLLNVEILIETYKFPEKKISASIQKYFWILQTL